MVVDMEITCGVAKALLECNMCRDAWRRETDHERGVAPSMMQFRAAVAMLFAWCGASRRGDSARGIVSIALQRAETFSESEAIVISADADRALRVMRDAMHGFAEGPGADGGLS